MQREATMSTNQGDPKSEGGDSTTPNEPAPQPALRSASPETDTPVEAEVADGKFPQPDSLDESPMKAADVNTLEQFIQFSYERKGKNLGTFRKTKLENLEGIERPQDDADKPAWTLSQKGAADLTRKLAAEDLLIEVPIKVLLLLEAQKPKPSVRNRIVGFMGEALAYHPTFQSPVLQAALTESPKTRTREETFGLFDALEGILAGNSKFMAPLEHLKVNERKTLRFNALRSLALYLSNQEAWEPDLQVAWHEKYLWQPAAKKTDGTNFWRILLEAKPADNKRTLAQLVKFFLGREEEAEQEHKDRVESVRNQAVEEAKKEQAQFARKRDELVREHGTALQEAADREESLSQQIAEVSSRNKQLGELLNQSEQRSEEQNTRIEDLRSEIRIRDAALENEKKSKLQASLIAADQYQQLRTQMMSMLENRSLLLDDALQATRNNKNEIAARRIEQSLEEFSKTIEELRSAGSADQ